MLYNSELFEKKCNYVGFCDFRYRSCSQQVFLMIMRLLNTGTALCYCVFWKKLLLLACFVVEYRDSNGCCQLIDISIYKITEGRSLAISQTKNDHIELYLVIMKVKKKFYI